MEFHFTITLKHFEFLFFVLGGGISLKDLEGFHVS